MNRRLVLRGAVVAGIVLLLAWLASSLVREAPKWIPAEVTLQVGASTQLPSAPTSPHLGTPAQQSKAERAQTVFDAIEGSNRPITFWGKVIDQDEKPVSGVQVRYSYTTEHGNLLGVPWGKQRSHGGQELTDEQGLFQIRGIKGHLLEIDELRKPSYQSTKRAAAIYDYSGSNPKRVFVADRQKPVIFGMVQLERTQDILITAESGKGLRVPGDGTPARWDLRTGNKDPDGELILIFKRDPPTLTRAGELKSWQLEIGVREGGVALAEANEVIMQAPHNGYLPAIAYPQKRSDGSPDAAFYFKTADGKYGRLQLGFYPSDQGASARLFIEAWINPTGSRFLEPSRSSPPPVPQR